MLEDLQLTEQSNILLALAASRKTGCIRPLTIAFVEFYTVDQDIRQLVEHGLLVERIVTDPHLGFKNAAGDRVGHFITAQGRAAFSWFIQRAFRNANLGKRDVEEEEERIVSLLRRSQGASVAELLEITRWNPLRVDGHLDYLRHMGHEIEWEYRDDSYYCRIVSPPLIRLVKG